jgi:hypothetical protein
LSFHGKECEALALAACLDSLIVRLLHAQLVYDNPFSTDDDLETLRIGAAAAPLPPAAADFELARSIAAFDDEAGRHPSPDFRPRATPEIRHLSTLHRSCQPSSPLSVETTHSGNPTHVPGR